MRIIVCGTRTFSDYPLLCRELDRLTRKLDKAKIVVLSGGAKGADKLGEEWCFAHRVGYQVWRPDYVTYKKNPKYAPLARNQEMADNADACVAFWDGKSMGTADMIRRAELADLKVRVIRYEGAKK